MANYERYEVLKSETLGRYVVAKKDLKAGETILKEAPFVVGPNSESSLVCYNCYLPLISKFFVCKNCAVVPICPGEGCPEELNKWHNTAECEFFRNLKITKGCSPMTMVQNVGFITVFRALLKKSTHPQEWEEFMMMESHLEKRKGTKVWEFYENAVNFIKSLGLLSDDTDLDLVQKVCAIVDVNSFEVRGPPIPGLGCSEVLRGVYFKAALLAHDCVANTHMAINNHNLLVCHASTDIKKGDLIYYNYTDALKGTEFRQQHLQVGKYFKCICERCCDGTEMGTHLSSLLCSSCKTGYVCRNSEGKWGCQGCSEEILHSDVDYSVKMCTEKFAVLNKKEEKDLEEYIRNVSLILSPNHYLLLEAKQRLAGVLRDTINREQRPTKKTMRRKIQLCEDLLPVLEKLSPGICRTKAITLYELQSTIAQLSKKLFDNREITGSVYLVELQTAEKYLRRSLEMLFIEPGNSPEGELCAKALEEYRLLKSIMSSVCDAIHADGKTFVSSTENQTRPLLQ